MRILYTFLWILALPFVLIRLFLRGRQEPGYRQHVGERFGIYSNASKPNQPTIWVHAVSVGETRAAEPLIRQLQKTYPHHLLVLTHMTPTGRATGAMVFPNKEVQQSYLPYDIPFLVQRFITHFKPVICILMETEVWPNLIYTCQRQGVPVVLANARMSEKSFKNAARGSSIMRPANAAFACVFAQTEADAQRIRQLGAPKVVVTGNIKFDVTIQPEQVNAGFNMRQQFGTRPVLLCASTREGEEDLILDAYNKHASKSNLLLLIVPRHPQRFDLVAQLIQQRNLRMERRTKLGQKELSEDTQVVLGDSMGELISYYASSDIAFIGGSLLPLGGQNLIEACAVEKPVIIGQHTFNFSAISADAVEANCALRVNNADELMETAINLIHDSARRTSMAAAALNFANQHRGATARTLAMLQETGILLGE